MGRLQVQAGMRDRRGLVSLEYAVLAAAVVTAVIAATTSLQTQTRAPFERMETAAQGASMTVRYNPF